MLNMRLKNFLQCIKNIIKYLYKNKIKLKNK